MKEKNRKMQGFPENGPVYSWRYLEEERSRVFISGQ